MRAKWIYLANSLKNDKSIDIDIDLIRSESDKIYNLCILRQLNTYKSITNLITARTCLENCLILTKNMLSPERNKHIEDLDKVSESYKGFVYYLGIANARLDLQQQEFDKIINQSQYSSPKPSPIIITAFKELILEYINNFILFSFMNALKKYHEYTPRTKEDEEGNTIIEVKDKDLFLYFLFLEFYHTAEVIGNPARQLVLSGKLSGFKPQEMKVYQSPPSLPANIKTEMISPDMEAEYMLNDAFQEEIPYV